MFVSVFHHVVQCNSCFGKWRDFLIYECLKTWYADAFPFFFSEGEFMKKIISISNTPESRRAALDAFASRTDLPQDWDSLGAAVDGFKKELSYPAPTNKQQEYGKQHTPKKTRELVDILTGTALITSSSNPHGYSSLVAVGTPQESGSLKRSVRKQALMATINTLNDSRTTFSKDELKTLLGTIAWRVTGNRVEMQRSIWQMITSQRSNHQSPGNKETLFKHISESVARHGKTACDAIAELLEEGTGNKTELIALYVMASRYKPDSPL